MILSCSCTLESSKFHPRQSNWIDLELDPGTSVFKKLLRSLWCAPRVDRHCLRAKGSVQSSYASEALRIAYQSGSQTWLCISILLELLENKLWDISPYFQIRNFKSWPHEPIILQAPQIILMQPTWQFLVEGSAFENSSALNPGCSDTWISLPENLI